VKSRTKLNVNDEYIQLITKVRQGLVTCHGLIFTNKCCLSKDKFRTNCGLGIYEMVIYEVVI